MSQKTGNEKMGLTSKQKDLIIYCIEALAVIIALVFAGFYFKARLDSARQKAAEKSDEIKIISYTPQDAGEKVVEGYLNNDPELVFSTFPDADYTDKQQVIDYTQNLYNESYQRLVNDFGEDYTLTYKFTAYEEYEPDDPHYIVWSEGLKNVSGVVRIRAKIFAESDTYEDTGVGDMFFVRIGYGWFYVGGSSFMY